MIRGRVLAAVVVLVGAVGRWQAAAEEPAQKSSEDYSFDVEAFTKRPYEWGGFVELKGTQLVLDRDARLQAAATPNGPEALVHQASGLLNLDATLRTDRATAYGHLRGTAEDGEQGFSSKLRVFRLSLALQPISLLNIEVGKTRVRWGKGYAFNPTAFMDRPKDPGDPDEALEGFFLARAELTKSFSGPLETVSLSLAVLPVYEGVNEDFGRLGHENFAAKLYLLLLDTDIDLVALSGGSRSTRYGISLAHNITANFEVHAEAALLPDAQVPRLAPGEAPRTENRMAGEVLAGARYLSPQETTYIVEYYLNSAGASPAQMALFYQQTVAPTGATGEAVVLDVYRAPFPMRHYAYLRISQKEPFDVLDFFPSMIGIVNIEDGSFTLTPELLYKRITNVELRLRGQVLVGTRESDFGERPNDARVELRVRYFF